MVTVDPPRDGKWRLPLVLGSASVLLALGVIVVLLMAYFIVTRLTGSSDPVKVQVWDVIDGDTIIVVLKGRRERVQIVGIDCPETGEPGADEATVCARQLLKGKEVTLHFATEWTDRSRDGSGRLRARVVMEDGHTFGAKMRKLGHTARR